MSDQTASSPRERAATAAAWFIAGGALLAASVLEFAPGADLRGDGDNPADSLAYLAAAGRAYLWSGALLALGGASLVVGAVGRWRTRSEHPASMLMQVGLALATISAGLLIGAGALRMQATGTVPHIASLDQAWGEAAYLAVQLAGTQGMLSAGTFVLLAVTMCLSIAEWRGGRRAPLIASILPAVAVLFLVGDLLVPGFEDAVTDELFFVYVGSALLGVPLWCCVYGASLLSRRRRGH